LSGRLNIRYEIEEERRPIARLEEKMWKFIENVLKATGDPGEEAAIKSMLHPRQRTGCPST